MGLNRAVKYPKNKKRVWKHGFFGWPYVKN